MYTKTYVSLDDVADFRVFETHFINISLGWNPKYVFLKNIHKVIVRQGNAEFWNSFLLLHKSTPICITYNCNVLSICNLCCLLWILNRIYSYSYMMVSKRKISCSACVSHFLLLTCHLIFNGFLRLKLEIFSLAILTSNAVSKFWLYNCDIKAWNSNEAIFIT